MHNNFCLANNVLTLCPQRAAPQKRTNVTMITDELKRCIVDNFGFRPTTEQAKAIDTFCVFLTERNAHTCMILRGSAGTGKTSLASAFVRALTQLRQKLVLLAPTGRAAKVFSLNAGTAAYTIHRRIYRQKSIDAGISGFSLNDNLHTDTLFIIDEASMVANMGVGGAAFGSGCLLNDLVQFVYSGRNCRMMLIGDKAQLPPVGEEESPALQSDTLRGYGLAVHESDLNEVLRQSYGSGILYNATAIRSMITHDELTQLPLVRFKGFADIHIVTGDELIEQLASSYSMVGMDETMVVTRSNKRANIYNQGIRNMVLGREEELTTGDMLMIVKNNYYWTEKLKKEMAQDTNGQQPTADANSRNAYSNAVQAYSSQVIFPLEFIANGDHAEVVRVRNVRKLYGFRFADITLRFPDYDDYELTATTLLDTLRSEAPALTHEQDAQLFNAIMEDYADIPLKRDRLRCLKTDPFYNAIQIKFAYAVTCHKAQGGQWAHVYVDQGYMTDEMLTPDYIHWLYTAFTRATEQLYLVNWPKTQTSEE